ncbi:MBL fold metallo-hydrolase [Desulfatiferula olefinivorans]
MNHPAVHRLTEHVFFVEAPEQGRFPYCHGFVFKGRDTLLIDAGLGDALIREVDDLFHIDILVISHCHPDHIRSLHVLGDRALFLPRETPEAVDDLETLGAWYTGSAEAGRHWVEVIGKPFGIVPLRRPDRRYGHGDIFDIGTARIEAVHVPGHHEDHYCFLDHVSGTLITTDIDFSGFGPWYGNPSGKVELFMDGVRRVMALPYKRVCSSHRPPIEGDAGEAFNAFLAAFDRQKREFFRCLGQGKTLEDLVAVSPLYHNKFLDRTIQNIFERHMAEENLARLIAEGRVTLDSGVFRPTDSIDTEAL